MKIHKLFAAIAALALLTGCDSVKESVDNFIENDANIGKHAPAVMGTIGDLEALNEEAAAVSEANKTDEERAAEAEQAKEKAILERADRILSGMTREQKAGQVILARMPDSPDKKMAEFHYGGYTMYADDFKNSDPEGVKALTERVCANTSINPFFAVDEEGGTVIRVSKFTQYREEPFSSPQLLFERGGRELLEMDTEEKARLLTSMGINLNLAPVADLTTNEESYIYPRTMGQGIEGTSDGVSAIVKTSADNGLACCIKHFPGYGENTDTHNGAAHDDREIHEFYNRDYVPFRAGIEAAPDRQPAIMVGHTVYDNIDEDIPASLSPVIHKSLRERLPFDGVVITDDLGMDAIGEYETENSVYVEALLADNDMLCVSDGEKAFEDIMAAYEEGIITDEILNTHVKRILIMKLRFGIIS